MLLLLMLLCARTRRKGSVVADKNKPNQNNSMRLAYKSTSVAHKDPTSVVLLNLPPRTTYTRNGVLTTLTNGVRVYVCSRDREWCCQC